MKPTDSTQNLFVVNTPHQLLNAIEAIHFFRLTNNHLLVVRPRSGGQDRFISLIKPHDWATVGFPTPFIDGSPRMQKFLGPRAFRWYCRYLHFQQMAKLTSLARRFRRVDKLFIGHYFAEEKPFMRHLANTIQSNAVYLLDDGTDTIEINRRRHSLDAKACLASSKPTFFQNSLIKTVETRLRNKYWDWHLHELPSLTFFTIYDLDVRKGDQLIRNDYSYLRSQAVSQKEPMNDTVLFIGQCIADGYFEVDLHFEFLLKIKEYFTGKRLVYVAHPRETEDCMKRIREELKWDIWPSTSVIEHDLIVRGIKPNTVAGFVSSALITLAYLFDPDVRIVCFHIAPEHWKGWREDAIGVYDYLRRKAEDRITVVSFHDAATSARREPLALS